MAVFLRDKQVEVIKGLLPWEIRSSEPKYSPAVEFVREKLRGVKSKSYEIHNGKILLFCDSVWTMENFSDTDCKTACQEVEHELATIFGFDVKPKASFKYVSSEEREPEVLPLGYWGETDTWYKYHLSISISFDVK